MKILFIVSACFIFPTVTRAAVICAPSFSEVTTASFYPLTYALETFTSPYTFSDTIKRTHQTQSIIAINPIACNLTDRSYTIKDKAQMVRIADFAATRQIAAALPTKKPVNITASGSSFAHSLAVASQNYVTPEQFGALGDGSTNDTAAIMKAISTRHRVHLGPKTYAVTRIVLTNPTRIEGTSRNLTTIKGLKADGDVIFADTQGYDIRDMTIDRAVPATSGTGININNNASGILKNVVSQNHRNGFIFGATAASQAYNLVAQFNYSTGIVVTTSADSEAAQWTFRDVISQMNDGLGWSFWAVANSSGPNQTGPSLYNCGSYANSDGGWSFSGDAHTAWNDINTYEIYSSFDNGNGIAFHNPGANNQFLGTFVEFTGAAATGRKHQKAATNTGSGILFINSGNVDSYITLSGTVQFNAEQGLLIAPTSKLAHLILTGFTARDNGASGSGASGIDIESSATRVVMSAILSVNMVTKHQNYGLMSSPSAAPNVFLYGGDLHGNAISAVNSPTSSFGAFQAAQ